MKVTLITLLAAAQGLLATALPTTNDNVTTLTIPSGHGATGTIVADTAQATQYLLEEAGIDVAKFLEYVEKAPAPEHGVKYPFPAGSGLEGSHVVFDDDDKIFAVAEEPFNCDKCWTACIAMSWFPPAWAICSKCFLEYIHPHRITSHNFHTKEYTYILLVAISTNDIIKFSGHVRVPGLSYLTSSKRSAPNTLSRG